MKVLDHQELEWFLFQYEDKLLLDCNCSHSFIGYSFMIELNSEESEKFHLEGRGFLSELFSAIQNSAPIMKESNSIFKGRDISEIYAKSSIEAVRAWQKLHLNR